MPTDITPRDAAIAHAEACRAVEAGQPRLGYAGPSLVKACLRGVNLRGADFCGADLRDAELTGADLCDADLTAVDLRGANLCDADLRGQDPAAVLRVQGAHI